MAINNLPAAQQKIVQSGFLERFFEDALFPHLHYRRLYEAHPTTNHLGTTFTVTKKGLLPLQYDPLATVTNSDLTSGVTLDQNTYEQYSFTIDQYARGVQTNLLTSSVSIGNLYKEASEDLGRQAGRSLDAISRNKLFQAYNGGRTFVDTAVGAASTSIPVANLNGFDFVYVNGVRQETSIANPHPITIDGSAASVTAVTSDGNTTRINKQALDDGVLTVAVAQTAAEGDLVLSDYAPFSIRPNGKTSTYTMTASDTLTYSDLVDASVYLQQLAVPAHDDGFYHAILDPTQVGQLMKDPAVQRVFNADGANSLEFQRGLVAVAGGVKIFQSQATPNGDTQTGSGTLPIRRGIVTGRELGYEAQYEDIAKWLSSNQLSATGAVVFSPKAHVAMILRDPLDALQQVITQTWSFIGDWVVATDTLSDIGDSAAYYKRAVVLESA